jgi:putative ABC transport system permease protein
METLLSDLRYGARMLFKHPGFTAVAVITMALGIGANTAIFSVVNALLLRPPDYAEPERLVTVWGTTPSIDRETASYPDYLDWRDQNTSFSSLAGVAFISANVTGDGEPERMIASRVTSNFLSTLGVAPVFGRDIRPEEDVPNGAKVVLVSHGVWKRRYGGDRGLVDRSIDVNGVPHQVVGILPEGFRIVGASRVDLMVPLAMGPTESGRRNDFLSVVGRLAPGVSVEQANVEMKSIAARLEQQYPDSNTNWTTLLIPVHELMVESLRPALLVLLVAVALVLLIACANVANLLLARSAARHREMAIRAALGAGRWRIARQVLTESLLLAVLGGGVGLLVAPWAIDLLLFAVPSGVTAFTAVALDRSVILFAAGLSIATGLLFGLAPALQISKVGAGDALKEGGRGNTGDSRKRLRGALVASQIALALVLLVGVGLMVRSFQKLQGVELGFDPEGVMTARVTLPKAPYGDDARMVQFYDALRERVSTMPGVTSAGMVNALPILGGGPYLSFDEQGAPPLPPGDSPDANIRVVDPGYFDAMRIPLRAGRSLAETDRAGATNVILINETMAHRYWPGQDPIGRRIAFDGANDAPNYREIVGVVGDVRHEDIDKTDYPAVYVTYMQRPAASLAVVLRTDGDPTKLAEGIRGAVRETDRNLPVYSLRTMDEALSETLAPRRYATLLLGAFGLIALVLAAIGIYGVMSYLVAQRTQEIGIRMALGAERRTVLGMVLRQGMTMAIAGLVAGALAAVGLAHLLASQLYDTSPVDPLAFTGAVAVLVAAALLACYIPARRATKVDPMIALRYE